MDENKASQKSDKGRLHLRKHISWNIGTVIFLALFLYILVCLMLYLTADHIKSYQVTSGPLSRNETCTALVMREETVVDSTAKGYVNYFARDLSKIRQNGIVYGISTSAQKESARTLDENDLIKLRTDISKFSRYYTPNNFDSVYDFKFALRGSLLSLEGTLSENSGESSSSNGIMLASSEKDGIVVYSVDGMESLKEEDLKPRDFEKKNYQKKNLKTGDSINSGDPVYKLLTSDDWSILFPVSDKQTVKLESRERIKVKFLKDGGSETGELSIITVDDQRYAKITFHSGMIRYANERYLDIELVTNTRSGLKIPISSIVKKEFYTVPSEMLTKNDENTAGFFREIQDRDGKTKNEFVNAAIYARVTQENSQQELMYLDTSQLKEGDVLVNPENNIRYTVGEKSFLEGVYCINKGYAVFRTISIIDQNTEFCIVESGTRYGIAQFDYIVLDGSTVNEKEIVTT